MRQWWAAMYDMGNTDFVKKKKTDNMSSKLSFCRGFSLLFSLLFT